MRPPPQPILSNNLRQHPSPPGGLSMDYLPKSIGDLVVWYANFAAKIGGYAATFNLAAAEVTQVQADHATIQFVVNGQQIRQTDAQEWTRYRDLMLFAPLGAPTPPTPTPGNVGSLPEGAQASIIPRLRRLVERIKAHPNYTEAIGEDLGIVPPKAQPGVAKPDLKARAETAFRVRITFAMRRHPMIEIQSRRGNETEFTTLAYDTASPYIDDRPPLNPEQSELREYRARYINKDNQPVGEWSDVVSVAAKP